MAPRSAPQISPRSTAIKREADLSDDDSSDDSSPQQLRPGSTKRSHADKSSEEYRKRRERNNLAVKKSRSKTKMRTQQTVERVNQLREENEMLEAKIKILTKELSFLKDLFLAHAGSAHGQSMSEAEMRFLRESGDAIGD